MSVYELIFPRFRSSRRPQKNFEWEELRRRRLLVFGRSP